MDDNKFTPNKSSRSSEKLGFKKWFNVKFVPAMARAGNQRHIAAIRDSFGTMIPLIIAGSLGVLINAIVFGGAGSGYVSLLGLFAKAAHSDLSWDQISELIGNGQVLGTDGSVILDAPGWFQTSKICGLAVGHMNTVTVGMMSIYFSFLFGYYISLGKGFKSPVIAGMVSTASFMLASLGEVQFFMDAKGLIGAIIFGIIATELFIWLSSLRSLNIKLPDSVPPAVGKSFAVFLPVTFTLMIIGALNIVVLAPAVVLGNLFVTGNTQATGWTSASEVDTFFNSLKSALSEKNPWELIGLSESPAWMDSIRDNLSADKFAKWYNDLSAVDQSQIASFSLIAGGQATLADMVNVGSGSVLHFGTTNGVIDVITASFIGKKLGPTQFGLSAAIYQFITSWFIGFATGNGGLGLGIAFMILVGLFWFFGVHGSNIMGGIFEPIFLMVLAINTALVTSLGYEAAAASGSMGVFTKPFFDGYAYVGGSGATLGLLIMTFCFSKRRDLKEIAKYSTPAGVFQINEPVIFGYPIVLNAVYMVPFVFTPVLNLIVGYIFSPAVLGFVNYSYILAPWTAPWFLTAVITSLDARALIPAMICLGVTIASYLPFVLLDNILYFKKLQKQDPEKYELEKRYYSDKLFRFQTNTETKIENLENKAEYVVLNAESTNEFWAKRLVNPKKLEERKQKQLEEAKMKREKILNQVKEYKDNRAKKYIELEKKVNEKNSRKASK
ncbi:PTS sugar transporter subunit IIC [Spiroplasma turonicum]|uniref:PTS system cellobiose-specific IIC component n=1 Tax=Spiroplasma turonicum TaxID=216946 RepID=A0A0K1P5G3_9MOLU|nr:PTS transporter subunit EIIC [Spiroplasma turonicum]AKU79541.1 PTS system cellobiose-specific IIC component [Spiroplasma turonicum]ALX70564.1 PTS system, cellobiose-specific IIC component [Spiroplasma turonicum]